MTFAHAAWLPAGAFACLALLWLWRRYDARQHAALASFVSAHLRVQLTQSLSVARRRLQRALLLTSVALLFVALAAPLYGYRWELVSRRGNEIVFALDTSRSMSTPDVKPNRLMRAKLAIDDFSNQLDGDGVGLVAFAGSAFLVCPITLDYGAFHESLNAIDTNTIPRGGTNTASAIREAQAALRRRPGSDKILILVTDGEDLEGDALTAAKAAASEDGLKIYTVGVGTPQGDLIPVSGGANGGFVKDDSGAYVKSRLDESALKAIAAATGGIYAPLGAQGQGLETIYRTALAPMLKHDLASRRQRIYTQRYQWPLAASLCLLILSLLVGNRRRMPAAARRAAAGPRAAAPGPSAAAPGQAPGGAAAASTQSSGKAIGAAAGNASSAAAASLAAAIVLVVMMGPTESRASPGSAEDAYQKGDYAAAAKQYAEAAQRDPKKPVLAFNAGAAAYKAGQYAQAAKAFQQAISRVPSADPKRLAEQEDAYYNLGNTLYRSGQATETSAPQTTLEAWNSALKAYDTALQMRPDDADSKFNRDLVKRKIDELKQNQQNNQGNQNDKNDKNDKNNQNKQSGQSGQSGQNNQPPDQGQKPPQDSGQPPNQQQQPQQPPNQQQPNQPPPQQAQQPPNAQPPPGGQPPAGQPPGQQQQPPPPSANQPANQKPGAGQPKPASEEPPPPTQAESPPAPGQMTQEQARELLDSQKEDERRALGLPYARQEAESSPDTPVKDW